MVDRNAIELTESTDEAERLFIEDFDTCDMTGYYLYSKLLRSGVSRHIGTGGGAHALRRPVTEVTADEIVSWATAQVPR